MRVSTRILPTQNIWHLCCVSSLYIYTPFVLKYTHTKKWCLDIFASQIKNILYLKTERVYIYFQKESPSAVFSQNTRGAAPQTLIWKIKDISKEKERNLKSQWRFCPFVLLLYCLWATVTAKKFHSKRELPACFRGRKCTRFCARSLPQPALCPHASLPCTTRRQAVHRAHMSGTCWSPACARDPCRWIPWRFCFALVSSTRVLLRS
jgi:hypothetical protein